MHRLASVRYWLSFASVIAVAVAPAVAHADVLGEVAGGIGIPMGDGGHEELVDRSRGIGVRFGYLWPVRRDHDQDVRFLIGPEVAATYDAVDMEDRFDTMDVHRMRFLGGVRALRETPGSFLYGRIGAGLDHWGVNFTNAFFASVCRPSATLDGLALGGGVGLGARVGRVRIGGELDLAWGDHGGDQPACMELDAVVDVLDNRSVELGVHVVLGAEY